MSEYRAKDRQDEKHIDIDLPEIDKAVSTNIIAHLINDLKDRRKDFWIKRIFRYTFLLIGIVIFVQMQMGLYGYSALPSSKTVGVVRVEGLIAGNTAASANAVIPVLEDLFNAEKIEGIVLHIKSGGGSPNESERINDYIDHMKKKTGKKVVAVCDGVCASAAYMIAIHSEKIYASRYTIVGSIGAIMQGWDFHKTIDLIDADYRVFASGEYKDLMNTYKALDTNKAAKLQGLVNKMAQTFKDEVIVNRDGKVTTEYDVYTGEVFDGKEAYSYGLVDQIGTLEMALNEEFPDLPVKRFAVRRGETGLLNKLFSEVKDDVYALLGISETPIQFKL